MNLTYDYDTGLSTEAISKCTDKAQLLQWKDELFSARTDIKRQLDEYNIKRKMGENVDFEWFLKAKTMLGVKSKLLYTVDTKLTIMRDEQRHINVTASRSSDEFLISFIDWFKEWQSVRDVQDHTSLEVLIEFRKYQKVNRD